MDPIAVARSRGISHHVRQAFGNAVVNLALSIILAVVIDVIIETVHIQFRIFRFRPHHPVSHCVSRLKVQKVVATDGGCGNSGYQ